MIQSYLKTGMVFYADRDKQHFRRDCCKETFCQFTDSSHFPSFQFLTDFPIDEAANIGISIYDLNDNLIVAWVADNPDILIHHHADDNYQMSHDYRDDVVFPVEVDYETCYYLRLYVASVAEEDPLIKSYYSEAFKICDCEVDGLGDGLNLIENGWFEDWSGAANPNNVPDGWSVNNNDATNYVEDAGGECQMISDNTQSLHIRQAILSIGKWYVATINITTVVAGFIDLTDGISNFAAWNTTGVKNIIFQAGGIGMSLRRSGVTNITFTNFRVEELIGFTFCDLMTLNWWADCDWDDIIYHDGFRNSLVLADPEKIELQLPAEDIVINPEERLGEMFVKDVVIKKRYRFKIRIPEYLWNALIRLPAYGSEMPNFHCWITLPDGSSCPMTEVIVKGEWDTGNCFNTFEVEFVDNDEYPVVATNCCGNEDVSEI